MDTFTETDPDLLDAIGYTRNYGDVIMVRIWQNLTDDELLAVWNLVTNNGRNTKCSFLLGTVWL